MKYLLTLKPLSHNSNHSTYSVLAEYDSYKNIIIRSLLLPASNFSNKYSYMRTFSQGVFKYRNEVYLAGWNFIAIVDYTSFKVLDSFSHPLMSDIHSIAVTEDEIFIISTTIDALLCFSKKDKKLKWYWRVEDSNLVSKIKLPSIFSFLNKKALITGKTIKYTSFKNYFAINFKEKDFRGTDKTHSPYHTCHLNEVLLLDKNTILLGTKGFNDRKLIKGSIIKINRKTLEASFFANPGSFSGSHDLMTINNKIHITESANESIGVYSLINDDIKHFQLNKEGYFVRGISHSQDGYFVGFSPNRSWVLSNDTTKKHAIIKQFNKDFTKIEKTFLLNMFYPDNVGSAIHNILAVQP